MASFPIEESSFVYKTEKKHTLTAGVSLFAFDIHEKANSSMAGIHNTNVPGWQLRVPQAAPITTRFVQNPSLSIQSSSFLMQSSSSGPHHIAISGSLLTALSVYRQLQQNMNHMFTNMVPNISWQVPVVSNGQFTINLPSI